MKLLSAYRYVLIFLFSLGIFTIISILLRTFMGNLDENDHLTAAYLMTKGSKLYSDIFSHHFPFPYYWTYIFTPLWSETSPARTISIFRLSLTILQLIIFITIFLNLKENRTKLLFSVWLLLFSFFYILYQGNIILSESFSAIFIAGYVWILIPILIKWEKISFKRNIILTILSALAFWTQPLLIGLFIVPFLFTKQKNEKIYLAVISSLLILLPLIYFGVNGQLNHFINQAIWFNYKIYPNLFFEFILPGSTLPPIFQTMILFIQNEFKLFISVENWLQLFQFIAHIAVYYIVYVLLKKKLYFYTTIFTLLILFSRLREIKVTTGVPFVFGIYPYLIIASTCGMIMIYDLLLKNRLLGIIVGLVFICSAFIPSQPIFVQSLDRTYNYYVFWSTHQQTGELIQSLTTPDEKILIYPHDVDLYYFAQRQPIDRFLYWYDWFHAVDSYRNERTQALITSPPAVIYVGQVSYQEDKQYYSRFFPNLTQGYIQIKKESKPTGVWLREDLKERASAI